MGYFEQFQNHQIIQVAIFCNKLYFFDTIRSLCNRFFFTSSIFLSKIVKLIRRKEDQDIFRTIFEIILTLWVNIKPSLGFHIITKYCNHNIEVVFGEQKKL